MTQPSKEEIQVTLDNKLSWMNHRTEVTERPLKGMGI
jgi:hypothetical protein